MKGNPRVEIGDRKRASKKNKNEYMLLFIRRHKEKKTKRNRKGSLMALTQIGTGKVC